MDDAEYDKASWKIPKSCIEQWESNGARFELVGFRFSKTRRLKFPSRLPKQTGPTFREQFLLHFPALISRLLRVMEFQSIFFPLPLPFVQIEVQEKLFQRFPA